MTRYIKAVIINAIIDGIIRGIFLTIDNNNRYKRAALDARRRDRKQTKQSSPVVPTSRYEICYDNNQDNNQGNRNYSSHYFGLAAKNQGKNAQERE